MHLTENFGILIFLKDNSHFEESDQELLEKFYASHDNHWLGSLLQRYTLLLFGVCMKYLKNEEEAKDAVQQVFLKAITELHKYRVDYFKSWIYMVAKNHCLMRLREKGKVPVAINEKLLLAGDYENVKETHYEKDRALQHMTQALEQLNPDQRRCIILFYLEKKSYTEIATLTNFSMMQVKSYIQNGKRNLKILMDKQLHKHG